MADNVSVKDGAGSAVTAAAKDIGAGVLAPMVFPVDASGTSSIGALTETAPASDTASSGLNGRLQRIAQNVTSLIAKFTAGTTSVTKAEDAASADGDVGVGMLLVRKATPADTSGSDGDYEFGQIKSGRMWVSALIDTALPAGTALLGKTGIDQTTPGTTNAVALSTLGSVAVSTGHGVSGTGVLRVELPTDGTGVVGLNAGTAKIGSVKSRFFAAVGATLTRPANTTAYTANDAISNNATAGSVTAQTATVSDVNDDPITFERIRITTTDTGLGGIAIRAWLFGSDPTASTGVQGGDNAAFSQKTGPTFLGTMSGTLRAMFDGAVGVLTPDEGARITAPPVSGAKTVYILYQALTAFTPSANSTTIIPTLEGFQGQV